MKKLTPEQSRQLAGIVRTPLAQAYFEVKAPFWKEFREEWPAKDLDWFEALCIRSGEIAVEDLTDDPGKILPKLLASADAADAAQILEHLEAGPNKFLLNMDAIAAAVPTDKADTLPKAQPL